MSWNPPPIQIFDTLSNTKRELVPTVPGEIRMYVCGLTVYDLSHVGHARTFILFDVIRRYLSYRGYRVRFVRNHTDVDDKIIARAHQRGEAPLELAQHFIDELDRDLCRLNCLSPDVAPRVSQEIPVILGMVQKLVDSGHAYVVDGDVFYDVDSFEEYGKLSKKVLDDLRAGERVAVDERKRHPYDFALWKSAKPGEPSWPSSFGEGRPGWHIECSAMSTRYLGDTFDIHGGGRDLIFPHHENEIAQAEGATGKPFVNYWMHVGPLTVDGEKMSKSLGNFWTIREVLEVQHQDVLRFFMLTAHYRKPIGFSADVMDDARQRVIYFAKTMVRLGQVLDLCGSPLSEGPGVPHPAVDGYMEEVNAAMDDDFNTPRFLALLNDLAKAANDLMPPTPKKIKDQRLISTLVRIRTQLAESAAILGLFADPPARTLESIRDLRVKQKGLDRTAIESLVVARTEARALKDWARSDELRQMLVDMGISLMDSPTGTHWEMD